MVKDFYSITEFAKKLDLSAITIRRMIKSGRILCFRSGDSEKSRYRIPHTEIERLVMYDLRKALKKLDEEDGA